MSNFISLAGLAATLTCLLNGARAQIYEMGNTPLPSNRSLHTLYAFYVYSHEEAPERPLGQPLVRYENLIVTPSSTPPGIDLSTYKGVQLSILKYSEFWNLIDREKFCCTQADKEAGKCEHRDQLLVQKKVGQSYEDAHVYTATVPISTKGEKQESKIRVTGVYILVFSNCGEFADGTVNGQVTVRNSYGFLPGNEYHKMPFYGWLLTVYIVLTIAWLVLAVRWWKELFNIQSCITAVVLFGLCEAALWYIFFRDWNAKGQRHQVLFILSILSSVIKNIFSYMLVLVASLGWGVTRPYLDRHVILKIQAVCFLYIVLDFIREAVLSFRHSHSLSLAFVLLCLLPVSLLNGGIFYWVFTALSTLMETLKDRRQFEKLALFNRLWTVLIFALSVATVTLLIQIFNLSRSITSRWQLQWLFADGVSHVLFLVVLAVMMYLWAPNKYSQRYAYSQQVDSTEHGEEGAAPDSADVWADDGGLDDDVEDGESFWASTKKDSKAPEGEKPGPVDVIGAGGDVEKS